MVADKHFLYKELSYKAIGCFYAVYNELGPAHKEHVYHEALKIAFETSDIAYQDCPRLGILYQGKEVGIYQPDFILDNKVIVEIKSVLNMPKVFEKQLFYYLRGTEYKLGYLVNFGNEKIDIRRRVYDSARKKAQ
jgi:GxxExxY protein